MGLAPTVLVVDDDPLILDMVAVALQDAGYSVVEATDLASALDALRADVAVFAAVVTDIGLHGEADGGWEVARAARERNPRIAVVYMSGHGAHEWPAQGVPGSVLVPKPFALSQLIAALAGQLNIERPG